MLEQKIIIAFIILIATEKTLANTLKSRGYQIKLNIWLYKNINFLYSTKVKKQISCKYKKVSCKYKKVTKERTGEVRRGRRNEKEAGREGK